jgi:hypothetical protein
MSAEIDTYRRELRWLLDQFCVCLNGLDETQAHWRPAATANSAAVIVRHVLGSTRVYALGFGCGQPVTRDRAAEFTQPDETVTYLLAAVRTFSDELDAALTALPPERLDHEVTPPPELWGTGLPHAISGRAALVESIRHMAIHLGELRLTRDLVKRFPHQSIALPSSA